MLIELLLRLHASILKDICLHFVDRQTKYDKPGRDPVRALVALRRRERALQTLAEKRQELDFHPTDDRLDVEGIMLNIPKSLLEKAKIRARREGVPLDNWITMVLTQECR